MKPSHLLCGGLLTAALFLSAPASAQDTTLQVNGQGEVEVPPDRARISFAIETEAPNAREAGQENARLMELVTAALRETGIEGLRIETSGYVLQPVYRQGPDRQREIAGYSARNIVQVLADDVQAAGALVDAALGAGANRVAGLRFEIRDAEPHRRQALQRAVEQARGEAEVMAAALGMRLGAPTQVQGGAQRPPPDPIYPMARAEMVADQAATPIEAGLQRVTASVSITYRLHP